MPNNPVQVVLNTRDFFAAPESGGFGPAKDFFENRDQDFVRHRDSLSRQVSAISGSFQQSGLQSGIVKVSLRKEAWAKSHRPQRALFPPEERPCIGASGLGELYFQVTADGLQDLQKQIASAEGETRYRISKKGKQYTAPSDQRSDVGAVESIAVPVSSDKRNFSVEQGIQWLRDPRTGGVYLLELFSLPSTALPKLVDQYLESLMSNIVQNAKHVGVTLDSFPLMTAPSLDQRQRQVRPLAVFAIKAVVDVPERILDLSPDQHVKLLGMLDSHPYVRRVLLPPIIEATRIYASSAPLDTLIPVPERDPGRAYPKIGIIDGGIGSHLESWSIGSHQVIAPEHRETDHGAFIAGLLVTGQGLNGAAVCAEPDGCDVYDINILPDPGQPSAFELYYPRGIADFTRELRLGVEAARRDHGVRVFNLSLNLDQPVQNDSYGILATVLDRIADELDVIFVISAGNLRNADHRPEWPSDPRTALQRLAARPLGDTVLQPSESSRSIAVGALNPPNCDGRVTAAPTAYSRRGPGLRVGVKPDVSHFGGAVPSRTSKTGLRSCVGNGREADGHGTSYASPLVAKTLASLDSSVARELPRELLTALLIHGCEMPVPLRDVSLADVARQFVGFGRPTSSSDILRTTDNQITLVFNETLHIANELRFDFAWPRSLVNARTGACRGEIQMTLVYRPVLNRDFGSEFVRVNLDAILRQEEDDAFVSRVKQSFLPEASESVHFEHELIRHGLKWWPIKRYQARFPQGKGKSSNWRLSLESLTRSGEPFPSEGIPFALVLTISDVRGIAPVFNELRLYLRNRNVQLADIRTTAQVRVNP